MKTTDTFFAPNLYIRKGTTNIDFYSRAFGAVELRRFSNDDGSIHVSELSINGTIFHLHEDNDKPGLFEPGAHHGTTVILGLFVPDVHAAMKTAVAAGAKEISPATDYDYGYRQGEVEDPFGHRWVFQMKI